MSIDFIGYFEQAMVYRLTEMGNQVADIRPLSEHCLARVISLL